MNLHLEPFLSWVAPILSTVIVSYLTARINARMAESERRTAEKREAEAAWRSRIEGKLDEQDAKINTVLSAQCTQMRSDCVHKAHRYLDDLGCASTEEKQAFWAEYEDYRHLCEANGITNHFVDQLAARVMELPERNI